jgi:putative aldouronate transport system substrate-binding protein
MKRLLSFVLCIVFVLSVVIPASALQAVPVKSISLGQTSISLDVGKSYTVNVKFNPANTTQKLLSFSTSNKAVVLVDAKGNLTAVGAGKAAVTVSSQSDKSISTVLNVTVTKAEKVKLSFCLAQTGWGGEAVDPELMKDVQQVIEAKTNTELEVIAPPMSTYNDKLNVMLASGQIPDIYAIRKAMDTVQVYAARGYTMPLDELIKTAPEITSQVNKTFLSNLQVGGKLMAVPMYVPLSKVIWLRKDVVNKYGLNLSTTPTTDEFMTEMKKIDSKKYIPFAFAKFLDNLPYFFNPFGAYYGIAIKNGNYYDGFNTPQAKQALAYCAQLYKSKIWDAEFLTNENAGVREKLYTGRAASTLDYANRYIFYYSQSDRIGKGTDFVPIYELKGPDHVGGNLYEAIQDALAISPKSKNPEKALEVIKYYVYTEEGVKLRNLGVEGQHYTIKEGTITPTDRATNSGYKCDINGFFLYFPTVSDFGFKWDAATEKSLSQQLFYNKEVNSHLGPKYLIPGGKSDIYDKQLPAYKKKIDEISAKIITGAISVDDGFIDYAGFWNSINGKGMLEELNKK